MQRQALLVLSSSALALCLAVPASAASEPDRWVTFKTGVSAFGPDESQIDRTTVRREGPYMTFWTRIWITSLKQALVYSRHERLSFWSQKFTVDCAHHQWGPEFIASTNPSDKSAPLAAVPWISLDQAPAVARVVCEHPDTPSPHEPVAAPPPTSAAIENPEPKAMMIDGKPVALGCLMPLRKADPSRSDPIDLTKCGTPGSAGPARLSNGMIGVQDKAGGGYFYYTDLGQWDGFDVLWERVSQGGSSALSYLVAVGRDRYLLDPQDLAVGSNCSGGIVSAHVTGGHLSHEQAADAFDLVQWGDTTTVFRHGDLDAAHCIALLRYRDQALTGVSLTQKQLPDDPDDIKRFPFQACFNSFYNQRAAKGKSEMSASEFLDFKHQFLATCTVKQKS